MQGMNLTENPRTLHVTDRHICTHHLKINLARVTSALQFQKRYSYDAL